MNEFDAKSATWDSDPSKIRRAAAVARGIRDSVTFSAQMTALDYGCGTGLLSFELRQYIDHITLADSSDGMLAVLRSKIDSADIKNMTVIKLDLVTDPLPLQRYSIIYTLMTLHHVIHTGRILSAFFALLTQPGYLCIADLDEEDGSFHGPEFPGHKGFNRIKLAAAAVETGFHSPDFQSIFTITKNLGHAKKEYPVFLMTARK